MNTLIRIRGVCCGPSLLPLAIERQVHFPAADAVMGTALEYVNTFGVLGLFCNSSIKQHTWWCVGNLSVCVKCVKSDCGKFVLSVTRGRREKAYFDETSFFFRSVLFTNVQIQIH